MYRTPAQLELIISTLARFLPTLCSRVELASQSIEGRTMQALRLGRGGGSGRRGVLIVGGLHARELMNPDAIVELARDLILAYRGGRGITYGGRSWSRTDIEVMIETLDIWMIPCVNPDGRQRVLNGDSLWRPNTRDNPGTPCDGVDLNRNFDIAWGITTGNTSCNPCSPNQTYCGSAAFSEPEARNIWDFCDAHRIDVFVDVHSFWELVLYPWGHAITQSISPLQNFKRLKTGTCLPLDPPTHREYMRPSDLQRFQTVSRRIADSVYAVRGRNYTPQATYDLYPVTGTSSDWVYSRHIRDSSLHKTYAFAFETGPNRGPGYVAEDFHPSDPDRLALIKQDTKAALLALIEQSVCAIDFIGTTLGEQVPAVDSIRALRDDKLSTTKPGRDWIELFDRIQARLLGEIMSDESLTQEALSLLERAAVLVGKGRAKLTARDVERAQRFVESLAERASTADLKRDLSVIAERLASSTGQTGPQIVTELLEQAPRGRRRR